MACISAGRSNCVGAALLSFVLTTEANACGWRELYPGILQPLSFCWVRRSSSAGWPRSSRPPKPGKSPGPTSARLGKVERSHGPGYCCRRESHPRVVSPDMWRHRCLTGAGALWLDVSPGERVADGRIASCPGGDSSGAASS